MGLPTGLAGRFANHHGLAVVPDLTVGDAATGFSTTRLGKVLWGIRYPTSGVAQGSLIESGALFTQRPHGKTSV
jgi:hypothetical protein